MELGNEIDIMEEVDESDEENDENVNVTKYVCDRCNYETYQKSNFIRHLNNKIVCEPINSNISRDDIKARYEKNKTISCDQCNKTYTTRQGLHAHKKKCHPKQNSSQEKISNLEQTILEQNKVIESLKNKIVSLQLQLAENQKNEAFYQIVVEQYLNGTHKYLASGITDVTNNDTHAEIKRWSKYKEGLGQLLTYNRDDPKERLQMYFFGKSSAKLEACAISHCKDKNIEVFMFDMFPDRVNIVEYSTKNIVYTYISGTT